MKSTWSCLNFLAYYKNHTNIDYMKDMIRALETTSFSLAFSSKAAICIFVIPITNKNACLIYQKMLGFLQFFEIFVCFFCLKLYQLTVICLIIYLSGWIPSKQISMLWVSYPPEPKGSWREHLSAQLPTLHHALVFMQRDFHPRKRRFWSFFFMYIV